MAPGSRGACSDVIDAFSGSHSTFRGIQLQGAWLSGPDNQLVSGYLSL